jgi:hypothetical protein
MSAPPASSSPRWDPDDVRGARDLDARPFLEDAVANMSGLDSGGQVRESSPDHEGTDSDLEATLLSALFTDLATPTRSVVAGGDAGAGGSQATCRSSLQRAIAFGTHLEHPEVTSAGRLYCSRPSPKPPEPDTDDELSNSGGAQLLQSMSLSDTARRGDLASAFRAARESLL